MNTNLYTEIISDGLKINYESAEEIRDFISKWFDDFRWGSSTKLDIVRAAKEAQAMIADPRYSELLKK